MFQHLGCLIGINPKIGTQKRLPSSKPCQTKIKPIDMLDTVQEIAIYIHRFHNLDLFQQGWYQIKISVRWEDSAYTSLGSPARVVQCEPPDLGFDNTYGVWRINDADNSFSTQPFRIKYARQDILLSIMISFNLPLGDKCPSTSAVILKFELLQAPASEDGLELLAYLDASTVAVHEFRIPPKALLGLHSYCPVHFDAFHAVLVDISVHTSLLKASSYMKVSSDSCTHEDVAGKRIDRFNQSIGQVVSVDMKQITLVKTLLVARDTLLEGLQKLSKAIDQAIDLTDFSKMNDEGMFDCILRPNLSTADGEVSGQGKPQNVLEKSSSIADCRNDVLPCTLSEDTVVNIFHSLGAQLSYLWNTFLQFHRINKTKILGFLSMTWAKDRRAEWSIWMVCSKVEMPHHYISSRNDEFSHPTVPKRVSSLWKLPDDPAQTLATRAELHRRSIAQMKINNQSIQDMHIFGDPLRIPIIIVERVMNAPRRALSENSYFRNVDLIDSPVLLSTPSVEAGRILSSSNLKQNGRELKVVVFVHGFQGHHLDLRLVRNQWLLIDPKIEFLMSEVNEDKTSGDFREMGLRLAQEVVSFLKKKMDKFSKSCNLGGIKLSFVGHSIGNIIIRTALAETIMEPYLRCLYTYVSISGPHMGYLYSANSLFNSGMWLLKKLKGSQCIHQLTFTDDPDLRKTFLYRLCEHKTLESFRHTILLSSPQDGYVPHHSARIELCQAASLDYSKKGAVFLEMLNNCLDQIRAPTAENRLFMRCDVNFDTSSYGRSFNSLIGRAAHIEFLESDNFVKFIMWSFPELFR
ncbi:hypothetical protein P3X46_007208 [Hevea brasiliensis]|uniref:DUF676 domain-containing protein n=1 Tax=Hevea brasiliensis TaxID=3981 RepID=A0ABQ9MVB3_HEVBR|nr:uncharacterized protein LOC110653494 isoform X2 [Hevea brasiliensis]KAJ9183343.1 hypothetical protein P3X46_007208 [Hevea brasiliensis]